MIVRSWKFVALCGVLFGFVAAPATPRVVPGSGMAYLTFNRAVALPGVELPAGTYVFELALPLSEQNVVRVTSHDRRRIYLTAFTYPIQRPATLPRDQWITFGEARAGSAPPITAWFPEGSERGRQFIYR
jgi:hypothetical protein